MNVIITIINEGGRNGDLKMELTTNGADILAKGGTLMDLFGEKGAIGIFHLDPDEKSIYTQQYVVWEDEMHVLSVYHNKKADAKKWLENPKEPLYFTPDKNNNSRASELIAKISAQTWAVYSHQKLHDAFMEVNARYDRLKKANDMLYSVLQALNYENYKQDEKYGSQIKDVIGEVEKEMDHCIQKTRLMHKICRGDYYSQQQINILYRSFRGISEEENKKKLNIQGINDGTLDTSSNGNEPGAENRSQKENSKDQSNNNTEGETRLRAV